jgi:hypothetical protein
MSDYEPETIKWDLKIKCPGCGAWHESDGVRDQPFHEIILCPCDHVIEVDYHISARDGGHLPEEDE